MSLQVDYERILKELGWVRCARCRGTGFLHPAAARHHLSLLLLFVFKLQPQRKTLEEHIELVLERLKGLEDCQGKLYFPSLLMFWEHLSNRVLTS